MCDNSYFYDPNRKPEPKPIKSVNKMHLKSNKKRRHGHFLKNKQ